MTASIHLCSSFWKHYHPLMLIKATTEGDCCIWGIGKSSRYYMTKNDPYDTHRKIALGFFCFLCFLQTFLCDLQFTQQSLRLSLPPYPSCRSWRPYHLACSLGTPVSQSSHLVSYLGSNCTIVSVSLRSFSSLGNPSSKLLQKHALRDG